ncbi:MAG: hypothetical protein IH932_04635, partial [Thaumarchaeota archaeon]|nr:hypothetical protein [Nitrososphaerota archaeon]
MTQYQFDVSGTFPRSDPSGIQGKCIYSLFIPSKSMTSTSGGSYKDSLGYAKIEEERNKSSKVMAPSQELWEGMEKSDYGFLKRIVDTT